MKTLSPDLETHLASGTTTLCWCWKIVRRDAVAQGFTDHDMPMTFDGLAYQAVSGFVASEVQSTLGLAVDNLTVVGALSSATLNEDDLAAGLFDDAAIEIWRVNWSAPDQRVLMRSGNLGQVKRGKTGFQAEVRGLAHRLNQPTGRVYAYACDADLGDQRCGKDISSSLFTAQATVASVIDARRFSLSGIAGYANGWFSAGKLVFASGANSGRGMEIKRHAGQSVELWQAMSDAVAPGDAVTLIAGCDKQFSTCKAKFPHAVNFRGFPYMPGNDAVLATPSAAQQRDGGSRYGN